MNNGKDKCVDCIGESQVDEPEEKPVIASANAGTDPEAITNQSMNSARRIECMRTNQSTNSARVSNACAPWTVIQGRTVAGIGYHGQ